MKKQPEFSQLLLRWCQQHGRKNLPWQKNITPYRVWISEIMLQQTQVNTVIPYFQNFMKKFPDVQALAKADEDEVLHLWTGLGYYSRARNLHKAATIIVQEYGGKLPISLNELIQLPGIGRSTAGAILAISMRQAVPILDGNVKRVLIRYYRIDGWPGNSQTANTLWSIAEQHTPQKNTAAYTQAIMDLGSMICTRSNPKCDLCPLNKSCVAFLTQSQSIYPQSKPRKQLPVRHTNMLMICHNGKVLLQKRSPFGIWGSLWSFPECKQKKEIQEFCVQNKFGKIKKIHIWPKFRHTFSHFKLMITPVFVEVSQRPSHIMEPNNLTWHNLCETPSKGLAAPVKKLLNQLGLKTTRQKAH